MRHLLATTLAVAIAATAAGDGSSLFKAGKTVPDPVVNERGEQIAAAGQPTLAGVSPIAVDRPKLRQFNVHDIVTIIVREESKSKSEADAKAEKSASAKAELKDWILFNHKKLNLIPDPGISQQDLKIDVGGKGTFSGKGDVERKDSFLTKIAATVIDVKPNGNLVLEAKRFIKSDDEEITLGLTGTVRPGDVAVDNSVESSDVAELTVSKTTRGIARSGQKMGWLTRLFSFINPL